MCLLATYECMLAMEQSQSSIGLEGGWQDVEGDDDNEEDENNDSATSGLYWNRGKQSNPIFRGRLGWVRTTSTG